jgi:HEAT repeat protein/lysophospholipase L1-like esterase
MRASNLAGLAVNVSLSLAVTVVILGGAELVARRTEKPVAPHPLADTHGLDWSTEWQGDFYVTKSTAVGWPPWEDFNRDGMRDRTHTPDKPAGTFRTIALGDSVTLGYGFPRSQAWPQQLQALLDAKGPGVEVFNVAEIGWSTRQERYAYERIARRYHPDAVVLAIVLNDMEDLSNNLSRPPAVITALFRRSALVRRIVNAQGREIESIEELFEQPETARVKRGYELMFDEIRRLRDETRADGAQLTLMVMPEADQVGAHPHPPLPEERIGAFARAEGIGLLDPLAPLRAVGPSGYMDRVHLAPPGSARVADFVMASAAIPAAAYTTQPLRTALPDLDGAAVEAIAALLAQGAPAVRREAAWALGRRGASAAPAVPALAAALRDAEPAVRVESARALGALGPAAAGAALDLFPLLDDPRQEVRWAGADALSAVGVEPRTHLPLLERSLANTDPYVRGFAVWTLNEAGPAAAAAAPAVEALLHDPDPGVRPLAIRALGNMDQADPAAVAGLANAVLHEAGEGRWRAARALARLGPAASGATDALARALSDPDEKLRMESANALGRIGAGAGAAVPALVAAQRDRSAMVRAAAAEAVERITGSHP